MAGCQWRAPAKQGHGAEIRGGRRGVGGTPGHRRGRGGGAGGGGGGGGLRVQAQFSAPRSQQRDARSIPSRANPPPPPQPAVSRRGVRGSRREAAPCYRQRAVQHRGGCVLKPTKIPSTEVRHERRTPESFRYSSSSSTRTGGSAGAVRSVGKRLGVRRKRHGQPDGSSGHAGPRYSRLVARPQPTLLIVNGRGLQAPIRRTLWRRSCG